MTRDARDSHASNATFALALHATSPSTSRHACSVAHTDIMSRERIYLDYLADESCFGGSPTHNASRRRLLNPLPIRRPSKARGHTPLNGTHTTDKSRIGVAQSSGLDDDTTQTTDNQPFYTESSFITSPSRTFAVNSTAAVKDVDHSPRSTSPLHTFSDTTGESMDQTALSPASLASMSTFPPAATPVLGISRQARSSGVSDGAKMPEFFGQAIFQMVLCNPTIAHRLLKFSEACYCEENMEFLARVSRYHLLLDDVSRSISAIQKDFLTVAAPHQINLSEPLQARINPDIKGALASILPAVGSIFSDPQSEVERLVYTDVYPKFVRHQMSLSAAKALGGNRIAYAGLGDCFVLTDPTKADNPIVWASDGFVMVTGYLRHEIIPRNCRFLQGRQTERAAVARLKAAIDRREESVELLLNHKKTGEPFWNLLYTTPLLDANGNLVFFLGGQVNCSTTIHSSSDVLRVLGQVSEEDHETPSGVAGRPMPSTPQTFRHTLRTAFRTKNPRKLQKGTPGIESTLLDRISQKDLPAQMQSLYTAYSNVSVLFHPAFYYLNRC